MGALMLSPTLATRKNMFRNDEKLVQFGKSIQVSGLGKIILPSFHSINNKR
jgi:hypothetical protein